MNFCRKSDFTSNINNSCWNIMENWTRVFHLICSTAAFTLTCWCIYKYMKDDDVSLVNYKQYHTTTDSIYPSLTLCFNNPFLNDKLEQYGTGINTTTYSNFLKGLHWDNRMTRIDYDEVTLDISQYLEEAKIVLANGSVYRQEETLMHYVVIRSSSLKCFSFDTPFLPDVGVEYLVVVVKNSIFPQGYRPLHHDFNPNTGKGGGFEVRFNYPRQVFRSYFTAKWIWESLGHNATKKWIGMSFHMKNIEVLKRRSKYYLPCNSEWKYDDEKIMNVIIDKIQCKPPHWDIKSNLEICSKEKMKELTFLLNDDWGSPTKASYQSPCQNIENLSYEYSEKVGFDSRPQSRFMVLVHFPNRKYRQITHVQEYDVESMMGNIGGYIGLFLGYSLLQFPHFLQTLYNRNKCKRQVRHSSKSAQEKKEIKKLREMKKSLVSNDSSSCSSCSKLEEFHKQLETLTNCLNELESGVKEIRESILHSRNNSKEFISNNTVKKVKITEWNNSVFKVRYQECKAPSKCEN